MAFRCFGVIWGLYAVVLGFECVLRGLGCFWVLVYGAGFSGGLW